MNWNRLSYSQQELLDAWQLCESVAAVCNELGISSAGSSMDAVRRAAQSIGLSPKQTYPTRHKAKSRTTLAEKLTDGSSAKSSDLKKLLWREGLLKRECPCGIKDERLLTLDHINGKRADNRLDNLRILCYNCHAQTDTFGSKNKGR